MDKLLVQQLEKLLPEIKAIMYMPKSHEAYDEAKAIGKKLQVLLPGLESIKTNIAILNKYPLKGSDTNKRYFLDEFKRETLYDLKSIINNFNADEKV